MTNLVIQLLILILVFGLLAYVVRMLPLEPPWPQIAYAVLLVLLIIVLLNYFLWSPGYHVGLRP